MRVARPEALPKGVNETSARGARRSTPKGVNVTSPAEIEAYLEVTRIVDLKSGKSYLEKRDLRFNG